MSRASRTMWLPSRLVDGIDAVRRLGPYAFALRAIMVVAATVCWLVSGWLGEFQTNAALLIVVLAGVAAVSPDGLAPLALVIGMMVVWMLDVDPMSITWSFVPALCVLVVHVAAARAATTVNGAVLDTRATVLWLRRLGVVGGVTLVVWYVVVRLSESPGRGTLAATIVALLAVAGVALAFTWSSVAPIRAEAGTSADAGSSNAQDQSL